MQRWIFKLQMIINNIITIIYNIIISIKIFNWNKIWN